MPNHIHLLLTQVREGGVTEFISKISNSYTKYFNTKNKRVGPLFQGEFKAVHIDSDEQLLHVSRYIHLNPIVSYLSKSLDDYQWSSFHEYVNTVSQEFCEKDIILRQFTDKLKYRQFLFDQENYGKTLESIKHQLLDYEE